MSHVIPPMWPIQNNYVASPNDIKITVVV